MAGRGPTQGAGLTHEQMILTLGAVVVAGAIVGRWRDVLAAVGGWLTRHGLLLPPGAGGLQIPFLGGLDTPRLLILFGSTVAAVVLWRLVLKQRRARG